MQALNLHGIGVAVLVFCGTLLQDEEIIDLAKSYHEELQSLFFVEPFCK